MLRYLSLRGFSSGPLFCWKDGSPLTRPAFVDKVRSILQEAGVDASHYAGHSFRIGPATTAAANGVSEAIIQMLGRWQSDSYTRYIRTPDNNYPTSQESWQLTHRSGHLQHYHNTQVCFPPVFLCQFKLSCTKFGVLSLSALI